MVSKKKVQVVFANCVINILKKCGSGTCDSNDSYPSIISLLPVKNNLVWNLDLVKLVIISISYDKSDLSSFISTYTSLRSPAIDHYQDTSTISLPNRSLLSFESIPKLNPRDTTICRITIGHFYFPVTQTERYFCSIQRVLNMNDRFLQKGLIPVVVNEDEKYFFHLEN